jgi:hypothetical protein
MKSLYHFGKRTIEAEDLEAAIILVYGEVTELHYRPASGRTYNGFYLYDLLEWCETFKCWIPFDAIRNNQKPAIQERGIQFNIYNFKEMKLNDYHNRTN